MLIYIVYVHFFFSTADAHKMDIFTEFSTDASAFILKGL